MYCKDCKSRDSKGRCLSEKIDEDHGCSDEEKVDMLVYSYTEGGSFRVGDKFGCIHFKLKEVCEHGKGMNDYCEPCGRVNGG